MADNTSPSFSFQIGGGLPVSTTVISVGVERDGRTHAAMVAAMTARSDVRVFGEVWRVADITDTGTGVDDVVVVSLTHICAQSDQSSDGRRGEGQ